MKILLGIDGSRYSLAATRFVGEYLAQPRRHVDLLHVLPLRTEPGAEPPRRQPERLRIPAAPRSWLEQAEKRLQARGLVTERRVRRGIPTLVLTQVAEEGGYDLVVLGAKGRSDVPFLHLGSVAMAALSQHTSADVLLVRERELGRKKQLTKAIRPFTVLFATDGSARIEAAAEHFHRFFDIPHVQLVAVAVAELPEPAVLRRMDRKDRQRFVRHIVQTAARWARGAKPFLARPGIRPQARVLRGRAPQAIIEEAERTKARLIVLASRGVLSPVEAPLGSTALQIARLAPCSVLVVRPWVTGAVGEAAPD